MSGKTQSEVPSQAISFSTSYRDEGAVGGTDIDSIYSADYPRSNETDVKIGSTIVDLKVDVHRKNSSESSEEASFRPAAEASNENVGNRGYEDEKLTVVNIIPDKPGPAGDASSAQASGVCEEKGKRRQQPMTNGHHPRK